MDIHICNVHDIIKSHLTHKTEPYQNIQEDTLAESTFGHSCMTSIPYYIIPDYKKTVNLTFLTQLRISVYSRKYVEARDGILLLRAQQVC